MSSYIGFSPEVEYDTTNQLSDQVIAIQNGVVEYNLLYAPASGNLIQVFVNSEFYIPTVDYTLVADVITFTKTPFPTSGSIYIFYHGMNSYRLNTVSNGAIQSVHLSSELKSFDYQTLAGNDVDVVFTLNFTPTSNTAVIIHKNGTILKPTTDYYIIADQITFTATPATGEEITVRNLSFKTSSIEYQISSQSVTEDKLANDSVSERTIIDQAVTNDAIKNATIERTKLHDDLLAELSRFEEISSPSITVESGISKRYMVDTSGNSVAITLPATPVAGQFVEVVDSENSFDEFTCSILRNGKTIDSLTENSLLYRRGVHCTLVYKATSNDWKTIFYDAGIEFTGVQEMVSAILEGIDISGDYIYSSVETVAQTPWVFSVTPSGASFTEAQTLTLALTFDAGTAIVTGSGNAPTLTILLSDDITEKTLTYNSGSSTTTVLRFDYVVENGVTSTGINLIGFAPGDYTIEVNGMTFDIGKDIPISVDLI